MSTELIQTKTSARFSSVRSLSKPDATCCLVLTRRKSVLFQDITQGGLYFFLSPHKYYFLFCFLFMDAEDRNQSFMNTKHIPYV